MDYVRLSDEKLMELVEEGLTEALEILYDRYAGTSYSLALRVLGDRGAAEEVVQDTFMAVWQRAGTYNPDYGRLSPWLLRIARNRAVDELRRRRSPARRAQLGTQWGAQERWRTVEDAADPAPEPAQAEAQADREKEIRGMVGGALSELPENQREVLELAYLRGLSQREISEKTGIPLGTVKTRTRLALQKMRKALTPVVEELADLNGL